MIGRLIFFTTALLLTLSILFSYSFTTFTVLYFDYSDYHFLIRQAIAVFLGLSLIITFSKITPTHEMVNMMGLFIFFASMLVMILMYFLPDSMVTSAGGAKRWIRLSGFSISPVEFFKVGFIYFIAWSFVRKFKEGKKHQLKEEILLFTPYIFLFGVSVILITVFQNDLGQTMVLGLTLLFLGVFAGRSLKFFITAITLSFTLFIALVLVSKHRIERIKMWWAGVQDSLLSLFPQNIASSLRVESQSEPYQIIHSINAIQNGGFLGQGVGNGEFKLGFLSDIHTDFVLAGITEELGFLGVVIVSLTLFYLIFLILKASNFAIKNNDMVGFLFSAGIAMEIAFSFLINSLGISGVIPIKGIAVPFLSYGGSAILAQSLAVAFVIVIYKKNLINEYEAKLQKLRLEEEARQQELRRQKEMEEAKEKAKILKTQKEEE
jgi:cell division protein FtsW